MKKTRAIFQPLTPFKNMMNYRLLLIPRLFIALLLTPLCVTGVLAQEADSGQAEEGTTSDRKPGITVIVDAAGAVQIIDKPGAAPQPVEKGQVVPVGAALVTGPDGRVDLALSNGAFFQIQENSRFSIGQFEQDAYEFVFANSEAVRRRDVEKMGEDKAAMVTMDASEDGWNEMPLEPTVSAAKFSLDYGTMIGESKKLRPGSSMEISTPIGTAEIRGTIWRITIQPIGAPGSNTFRGTLDVARGLVVFTDLQGSRAIDVAGGFTMQIDVNVQAGQIQVIAVNISPLSAERTIYLESTAKNIQGIQTAFQAVKGTPAEFNIIIDSSPDSGENNAGNEGDTTQTRVEPGGNADGNFPPPPPRPTATPTPSPTLTPKPSNG
jgi:hypothetical protein